jgi:hypothetical protein
LTLFTGEKVRYVKFSKSAKGDPVLITPKGEKPAAGLAGINRYSGTGLSL